MDQTVSILIFHRLTRIISSLRSGKQCRQGDILEELMRPSIIDPSLECGGLAPLSQRAERAIRRGRPKRRQGAELQKRPSVS